jgi:hypothetical protein
MTTTHIQLARPAPSPLWAGIVSLVALLVAVYLRGAVGHPFREALTHLLGYEARAAVEHFASALACPILLALPFWPFTGSSPSKHPSSRAACRYGARAWLEQWPHLVVLSSAGYIACCYAWEWGQAFAGTSECAPRGYLQWEQLLADTVGAVVAIWVARRGKQHCR